MYVLQQCTHSHFQRYEIPNSHAYYSIMTCVSPASNTGGSEGAMRAEWGEGADISLFGSR